MFFTSQRTIYAQDLSLAQLIGAEYQIKPNTTLNEKIGVLAQEEKPIGVYPVMKYLAIGCGGQGIVEDPKNYPYSYHQPTDAALFKMMPFVVREANQDLNYVERQKYRLRKDIVINGKQYYAYYLKALTMDKDIIYKNDFVQISKTINPFSCEDKDVLNPTPISKIDKITSSTSSYVTKLAKVVFELTEQEVEEINKVFDLMGNTLFPGYAATTNKTITELGLCTGIDTVTQNGYTESICTQVAFHIGITLDIDVTFNSKSSYYKIFELGGAEPLYMQ